MSSLTMSFKGIDFDEQAFRQSRNGDYQKSLISELLEKTELDILTVLEFSRCYIIEGISF